MAQKITDKKKDSTAIKRMVSNRFLQSIEQLVQSGAVKNESEFAKRINEEQREFSSIKSTELNRFVDISMLYKAVNEMDYNANYFLVKDGDKTEELFRGSVNITGGTVNGNNNVVLTGQAVSQSGNVYFQVEKLIQSLPEEDRKIILDELGSVNTGLHNQIEALKKTLAQFKREIAKDELLLKQYEREREKDQKIISLYEKQQEADKKIIADQEKRIKDLEQSSSKKKSR